METKINQKSVVDQKTEAERNLTVLKNRLDMVGDKSRFVNLESIATTMAIAGVLRDETSKAANNGGNVDFGNFISSVKKIVERNEEPVISKIS